MNHPKVIRINDPAVRNHIAKLAEEDNDNMTMSSHAVTKGDEIVGGWNLCEVPMVLLWHDSKKVTARDSIMLNQIQESMLSQKGLKGAFIACNTHSPYHKHMGHFGFKPVWSTDIYYKNLPNL